LVIDLTMLFKTSIKRYQWPAVEFKSAHSV
jgi:hypothetical protein